MRQDKYLWVTASRAKPGKEAEYNRWYDKHVETFFGFPGLKRVSRNRCFQPFEFGDKCAQYMVLYEFEDQAALEAFRQSSVMEIAKQEYEESWEEIGETLWTGWWEPMKTLERE